MFDIKRAFASTAVGLFREDAILRVAFLKKEKRTISISIVDSVPSTECLVSGLELHEVVFRSLTVPLKSTAKVLDALPFQLEALLPFPTEQCIACPVLKSIDAHTTSVSLIATSKEILSKHIAECASIGIHPDRVSCVPLALFRLSQLLFPEHSDLLFFHFGAHKTSCIAIQDGRVTLSQSMRLGKAGWLEALRATYPDKTQQEQERLLSGPVNPLSPLGLFLEQFTSELERLSVFIREKVGMSSESSSIHWALIGEWTSSFALSQTWKKYFGDGFLSLKNPTVAESALHTHGLAIGYALDALKSDANSIQFLQGEFAPTRHVALRKKKVLTYALACMALSAAIALCSAFALKKKTRALSEKMHSYFSVSKELSIDAMEAELFKAEQTLQKQKNGFPFFLTLPKVSDVLSWLSTHPSFATAEGFPKEGIAIKNFRYQLVKFPTVENPSTPYQGLIDIEFTASTPRLAREFYDALLKGDSIVNSKKDIKWNAQGTVYSVQFELNKSSL
jgi:type IV pilus assembly protein PilM